MLLYPQAVPGNFSPVFLNIYFETNRAGQATTLPRQFDNFSGQNAIDYGISSTVYSLWILHLDTEAFTYFIFFLSRKLHYVVFVAKLKYFRVATDLEEMFHV